MPSTISKDLLARFSPSSEFYAISHGDGRVKIWDTLKGQLQVEFTDIAPASSDLLQPKPVNGHLSVDYTCMEWFRLQKKKKNIPVSYMLAMGTGSGDVLALDVDAGQLKWKVTDCHPGGVSAISFSGNSPYIFTAGVDGMVCQIDCTTGNLLGKFRASTKAISSISLSPDGKMLATSAGRLKVFNCSDHRKIQKFSGHPVGVRCMVFSEDGKYILSSAVGEKYITVWKVESTKNRSACCVLPMEHPIIFLDCKGFFDEEPGKHAGLYIVAVSEAGCCYFWHGRNIQHLHKNKPTTISLVVPMSILKSNQSPPAIYSAKLQGGLKPASGSVLVVHGSIKPHFEKVDVQYGVDVDISWSQDGVLLPTIHSYENQKDHAIKKKVTMLDRANAEDAVIPFPKIHEYQDKKRKNSGHHSLPDLAIEMADTVVDELEVLDKKVLKDSMKEEAGLCLEDLLISAGILSSKDEIKPEDLDRVPTVATVGTSTFENVGSQVGSNKPTKKMSDSMLTLFHGDASKLLNVLVIMWKYRSVSEQSVLPWISYILLNHGHSLMSHESYKEVVNELHKMTMIKCSAFEHLLHLSGRFQFITAQIDKSVRDTMHIVPSDNPADESDEDEDVDEVVYGEEGMSASSDDSDD